MRKAAAWAVDTAPDTTPSTKDVISSRDHAAPSAFRRNNSFVVIHASFSWYLCDVEYPSERRLPHKVRNELRDLRTACDRREHGVFIVEGLRTCRDLSESSLHVELVIVADGASDEVLSVADRFPEATTDVVRCSRKDLDLITDTATPQDIVALARIPERRQPGTRLLVLDGLSDPGNVGTIIRTAAWFGVSDIVLHGHGVDPYAPKVVRSAAGALFRSNIIEELDVMFDGRPILVSEPFGGAPPSQIADLPSWALVIGSEAHGVSDILRKRATQSVTIPGGHGTESLNAAIAASILLYEATR